MSKKEKVYVSGNVVLKGTFSRLRDPVDKKANRSRGPGQIGQSKPSATVRLGNIGVNELARRIALAVRVLETGKAPAKGEDANLAKLKLAHTELKEVSELLELTNAAFLEQSKTLEDLKKDVNLLDSPTESLEDQLKEAASAGADPVEPVVPEGDSGNTPGKE